MDINQYVFDTVKIHLLKQRARSVRDESGPIVCMYRSDNGLKCAVGALIDDDLYTKDMEFKPVAHTSVMSAIRKSLKKAGFSTEDVSKLDKRLLGELQTLHDIEPTCRWAEELESLRLKRDLE